MVTFQVLEPYSKIDSTLLLNMRTLRLFGNELQLGHNIPKAPLAFLTLQSTSPSLPPSLHISPPKYVNWFTSSTWCPFRTIKLDRGCQVVDELTILMDLDFAVLILSPKEAASFSSEKGCLLHQGHYTTAGRYHRRSPSVAKSCTFAILCRSDVWR